jgi:hypothetical protein
MTISLEFDLGDRKIYSARIKSGYDAAVSAATKAVQQELLEGSVATVRTRMSYEYRWAEITEERVSDEDFSTETDIDGSIPES